MVTEKYLINGVDDVIKMVNIKYPNYKNNKYLKMNTQKNLYLKNFNKVIAKIIYIIERKKMN